MESIRTLLQGKKTYLVAALLILTALLGFIDGASLADTIDQILIALGLGSLRAGVTTEAAKP